MRIFISYASEQIGIAKRLNLGLLASGNDAFFDRDDLVIDFAPRPDNASVHLGSTSDWFEVYPGRTRRKIVKADLRDGKAARSFKWRVCLGYVTTLNLAMAPKDLDLFFSRYRKEVCDSWRDWPGEQ